MEEHVGSRLKLARVAKGLSQEVLARKSGVSGFTVSKYERGVLREPHRATLLRLAEALSVDATWLLSGDGDGPLVDEVA